MRRAISPFPNTCAPSLVTCSIPRYLCPLGTSSTMCLGPNLLTVVSRYLACRGHINGHDLQAILRPEMSIRKITTFDGLMYTKLESIDTYLATELGKSCSAGEVGGGRGVRLSMRNRFPLSVLIACRAWLSRLEKLRCLAYMIHIAVSHKPRGDASILKSWPSQTELSLNRIRLARKPLRTSHR